MFENTKKIADKFIENGNPGIDFAVVKNGKTIFRYIKGYSDAEKKIEMRGDERSIFYSLTKPMTATAIFQLMEKRKLKLDDRLSDFIPEYANTKVRTKDGTEDLKTPITIKHLLTMTAGFSYNRNTPCMEKAEKETDKRFPLVETIRYQAEEPLDYQPGTSWKYSIAHDVLGAVIEIVSGMPFEDYFQKNIFDVAGMSHSEMASHRADFDTVIPDYQYDPKTDTISKYDSPYDWHFDSDFISGGGGLISTVDDYLKFMECLRTYKFIRKESLDLMTEDLLDDNQKQMFHSTVPIYPDYSYGCGVRCPIKGGSKKDFGWIGAAGQIMAIVPSENLSILFTRHVRFCNLKFERYDIVLSAIEESKIV